jgi:hypothetical protein
VLTDESRDVLALHHFGFDAASSKLSNRAVRIGAILDDLKANRRDYFDEIVGQR